MGTCDLIPGISGGTIAFITGIYSRMISAIEGISPKLAVDFFKYIKQKNELNKNELKKDLKKLDYAFLLTLGFGIATAIFFGSKAIRFLLENYFTLTIAFFAGLIIASSKIIFDGIQSHKPKNFLFGFVGFVLGAVMALLIPVNANPSLPYVFLGGFIAVSAMFLPGISGAFILLVMGLYEFMLKEVLPDIPGHLDYFIASALGAFLGMFFVSRIISFLFRKDKCKTLYVLLGLVLGSLIIPLKRIYEETTEWSTANCFLLIFFFALGVTVVLIAIKLQKKRKPLKN